MAFTATQLAAADIGQRMLLNKKKQERQPPKGHLRVINTGSSVYIYCYFGFSSFDEWCL